MQRTRKVKMLKDVPIARDKVACSESPQFLIPSVASGDLPHDVHKVAPAMFAKDEKLTIDADTAHGLVRDKLAEYEDEEESSDEPDECLTANEQYRDYGTAEHLDFMEQETAKEQKKNGQETVSDESRKSNRKQAARRFAQDRSYEGVAVEQVKNSDYAEGEKPAEQ